MSLPTFTGSYRATENHPAGHWDNLYRDVIWFVHHELDDVGYCFGDRLYRFHWLPLSLPPSTGIALSWPVEPYPRLDEAASAAYGWPSSLTDAQVLERLLALNHERAASQGQQGTERLEQSPPLVAELVG